MCINHSNKHLEILRSKHACNCLASFHVNIILVHLAIGYYSGKKRKLLEKYLIFKP